MKEFAKEVWDNLSSIDVSPHVEVIVISGGRSLSYVPWHKAWMLLKREYPASTHRHGDDIHYQDGTMEVEVLVTISRGSEDPEQAVFTSARLAVMDNRYKAIPNPNARDINDNRQRALVKALAFMGLGLSLWDSGSTVPVANWSKPINETQVAELIALVEKKGRDLNKLVQWAGAESVEELSLEKFNQVRSMLS